MTIGVLLVSLLYITFNVAYLKLLPVHEIAAFTAPAADAIQTANTFLGMLVPVLIMI